MPSYGSSIQSPCLQLSVTMPNYSCMNVSIMSSLIFNLSYALLCLFMFQKDCLSIWCFMFFSEFVACMAALIWTYLLPFTIFTLALFLVFCFLRHHASLLHVSLTWYLSILIQCIVKNNFCKLLCKSYNECILYKVANIHTKLILCVCVFVSHKLTGRGYGGNTLSESTCESPWEWFRSIHNSQDSKDAITGLW